ncbi:MAG: pilus assembly PilX family protein [Thermoleophilia bacterium]
MDSLIKLGKDEQGMALVIAIAVMSLMMIIGITTVTMALNSETTVAHDKNITVAQNFAEAGVDDVIAVTVANYSTIYPNGVYPAANTPFYSTPQQIKDDQQKVIGTYEVWTAKDPDRPGNVLITSRGTDNGGSSRTVKVSVKYATDLFSYVLLDGKQTATTTATFVANKSSSYHHDEQHSSSAQGNIALTGNIGVNGNMVLDAYTNGSHWGNEGHDGHHDSDHDYYESAGTITFLSRDGFVDTATYTGSKSGSNPLGTQPVRGSYVNFPSASLAGSSNVKLITLPNSSRYSGGWTRDSQHKIWKISAENFQKAYQSYNSVEINTVQSGYSLEIDGSCNAPDITATIWTESTASSNYGFTNIKLAGPGIRLNPKNGIALMADRGNVTINNEAWIGQQGHGALVYLSGKNGATSLNVTGNLGMWGSIVVNGPTTFVAQGTANKYYNHEFNDEHDRNHSSSSCSVNNSNDHQYDNWHHDNNHRTYGVNIRVEYDGSYLSNPNLPLNWWSWTGGSGVQAEKQNYAVQ